MRKISYAEAIREGTEQAMTADASVFLFGLGVDDPKRIFGTTNGLVEKFGSKRVFDVPLSENALTGIALGAASFGMRPILTHQRLDFALLSLDQIINNAAKWHYMFNGHYRAPMTIRMVIGRGWGQGPQHSQSLQALFAHVPGLKVVMPATPSDAKGLMLASIRDDNPVIYLEHRWLHSMVGEVSEKPFEEELGKAKVVRPGKDVTIIAASYMVYEAFRAADSLAKAGVEAEVVDLRTIAPLDEETILKSVKKTGRLIVADTGHTSFGIGAEILAMAVEKEMAALKAAPRRIACPDFPAPSTVGLAKHYYPRSSAIFRAALELAGKTGDGAEALAELVKLEESIPADVPDLKFGGPF